VDVDWQAQENLLIRAFQNGKIDLTQAEAIADLIGAKNKQALTLAKRNLEGNLSAKIDKLQTFNTQATF